MNQYSDSDHLNKTLAEAGEALISEKSPETLIKLLVDSSKNLTSASFGAFYEVNSSDEGISLKYYSGIEKNDLENIPFPVFVGQEMVRMENVSLDLKSYILLPMNSTSGILGHLVLCHTNSEAFFPKEISFVKSLINYASVAMENILLQKKACDAIRIRDEFLSVASHELKTPLTSLKLQMQILSRQITSGDKSAIELDYLKKMAKVSLKQSEQLVGIIDDMLDVSRISFGRMNYLFSDNDLGEIVQEALETLSSRILHSKVEVITDIRPGAIIHCDPFRIEQVLSNILSNALKYGQGRPIVVSVCAEDSMAILSVEDRGLGISLENQNRIFEKFERAVNSDSISGLGLGLYISAQIVEAHKGSISLESEEGTGSTFKVCIPLL